MSRTCDPRIAKAAVMFQKNEENRANGKQSGQWTGHNPYASQTRGVARFRVFLVNVIWPDGMRKVDPQRTHCAYARFGEGRRLHARKAEKTFVLERLNGRSNLDIV